MKASPTVILFYKGLDPKHNNTSKQYSILPNMIKTLLLLKVFTGHSVILTSETAFLREYNEEFWYVSIRIGLHQFNQDAASFAKYTEANRC